MKKGIFKGEVLNVFNQEVEGVSFDEKVLIIEKALLEYQQKNEEKRDTSNKGESWKDEELKIILLDAPTKSNCMKYAKIFKRKYGSIEQIYRWAATPDGVIKEKRPKDAFLKQIKKVAKEIGFRA